MGRFRTALATISVGALLATGQATSADGAQPITDEPHTTAPADTGGATPPISPPKSGIKDDSSSGNGDGGNKGDGGKKEPKPQTTDPKTEEIDPGRSNPQSADELAPDSSPTITMNPGSGLSGDATPVAALSLIHI